jgi:hypothetical protein
MVCIASIGVSAALTGCNHLPSSAERAASFAPYLNSEIKDSGGSETKLGVFLVSRTAFVVATEDGSTRWRYGTAAAIDRRGYYLTAAHVVENRTVQLRVLRSELRRGSPNSINYLAEDASVVWRGDWTKGEPDLAILYDPRPPATTFDWEPEINPGEVVYAMGVNNDRDDAFEPAALAGKLYLKADATARMPGSFGIAHSAPLHPGDSGGPLVSPRGLLLGINLSVGLSSLSQPYGGRYRYAYRPELTWLRETIDRDYAERSQRVLPSLFWARPEAADDLARLLISRLGELEADRIRAGAADDIRAAYARQELVLKVLADEAGITNPLVTYTILHATPRVPPNGPTPLEVEHLAEFLRSLLLIK